jgi:hypothetical protein
MSLRVMPATTLPCAVRTSPYAFLAKDLIYELEDQFDVHLEWLPYTLDIPSFFGSARLDERDEIVLSRRATPTSGGECVTRTWTAGDKRTSVAW